MESDPPVGLLCMVSYFESARVNYLICRLGTKVQQVSLVQNSAYKCNILLRSMYDYERNCVKALFIPFAVVYFL
jgi:hypothetical protein